MRGPGRRPVSGAYTNQYWRIRHQGLTVGAYLLVAAIHRKPAPTSKVKIADGDHRTALHHALPFRAYELTSQRFWGHTSHVDEVAIRAMEMAPAQQMVKEFGVHLKTDVYDATDFFTWQDTMYPAELAQRGHQQQHRGDLRAVGRPLMVTTGFNLPLFHTGYPGIPGGHRGSGASTCDAMTLV